MIKMKIPYNNDGGGELDTDKMSDVDSMVAEESKKFIEFLEKYKIVGMVAVSLPTRRVTLIKCTDQWSVDLNRRSMMFYYLDKHFSDLLGGKIRIGFEKDGKFILPEDLDK